MHNEVLSLNEVESNRFGLNVFRLTNMETNLPNLVKSFEKNKADVVICRLPTDKNQLINELISSRQNIYFSEPLVEFTLKTSLTGKSQRLLNPDVSLEPYSSERIEDLNSLIKIIFANYSIHYSDNPFLNPAFIIDGYIEWVQNCAKNGRVFFVKKGNQTVGFFASTFKDQIALGGPGGLLPEFEGQGIYWDSHILMPKYLHENDGIKMVKTSTKASNMAVIKQWDQLGWNFSGVSNTLHLSPMLGRKFTTTVESSLNLEDAFLKFPEMKIESLSHYEIEDSLKVGCLQLSEPFVNYKSNQRYRSFYYSKNGQKQFGIARMQENRPESVDLK